MRVRPSCTKHDETENMDRIQLKAGTSEITPKEKKKKSDEPTACIVPNDRKR